MPDTSILMKWPAMQHVPPVCNTSSPTLAAATPSHPFAEGWMLWDDELYLCRGTTNICSLVLGNYSPLIIIVPADSQPWPHPLLFSKEYSRTTLSYSTPPTSAPTIYKGTSDNFTSSPVVYDFISWTKNILLNSSVIILPIKKSDYKTISFKHFFP